MPTPAGGANHAGAYLEEYYQQSQPSRPDQSTPTPGPSSPPPGEYTPSTAGEVRALHPLPCSPHRPPLAVVSSLKPPYELANYGGLLVDAKEWELDELTVPNHAATKFQGRLQQRFRPGALEHPRTLPDDALRLVRTA
jgi:hypothetical protein